MSVRPGTSWLPLVVCLVTVLSGPPEALAQPSGFELSLAGSTVARKGRPHAVRGIAYRVLGLAGLQPLARGRVQARYATEDAAVPAAAWTEVVADGRGAFLLDVPMPAAPRGASFLEVVVGDRNAERSFRFPLSFAPALAVDATADRRLYEPGETVHLWARVIDVRSHRPAAGVLVRFGRDEGGLGTGPRDVRTGDSGVASLDLAIPRDMREGDHTIAVRVEGTERQVTFRVGARVFERLFVRVRAPEEAVAPHAAARVVVEARTTSGAPVRGATVSLDLDGRRVGSALTGADGNATFDVRAPAYLEHETGSVGLRATVQHPAHGEATAGSALQLAVPLTLQIEPIVPNAGLLPEVDGVLWLVVSDGSGEPPPANTELEVRGPAVRGRPERVRTDARGIAEVPVRLPRGAATATEEEEQAQTTLVVHVAGPLGRTVRLQIPVLREARIVPRVAAPVIAAGSAVEVTLARRPSAARLPAVVEILSERELLASRIAQPTENRLRIELPTGWLGLLTVRARPLVEDGVAEGTGAEDAFIVRPAVPIFPTIERDRDRYLVRSRAAVTIGSPPGTRAWAAVLVRDLAAAGGESPFSRSWLDGAFEEAVLDPTTSSAERFLRTALAAWAAVDPTVAPVPPLLDALGVPVGEVEVWEAGDRDVLRDPFPLRDDLLRRGIGPIFLELEQALEAALGEDRLDEVTVGRGAARRFRADVLESLTEEPLTLGDEPATLAMLQAADPSFSYETVARRVARRRLVELAVQLAGYLDPGDEATVEQRMAAREPSDRWLTRMVERGVITPEALLDPWGGHFVLRASARPALTLAVEAAGLEVVSPGPDGRAGTPDDVRDPFARAVPAGTPYAVASGEDELLRSLSLLSSAEEVLAALLSAYSRMAAEVAEEAIGDAMQARASEGSLASAMIGDSYGYGGLGLRGTGRGGGGSGYGSLGVGSIGTIGRGAVGPLLSAALARVVRERFPATLAFMPAVPLDASGRTTVHIPLADAITTYRVEAVVWSAEGFIWSAATNLRVDQEITVDAPVPEEASVGDRILLPLRVQNRGEQARDVALRLELPGAPAISRTVRVPPADATEVPVTVPITQAQAGRLTVLASSPEGVALDAVRRPMVVRRSTRRVREEVWTLTGDGDEDGLSIDVARRASRLPGSEVHVSVGLALFPAPRSELLAAWASAFDPALPASREPLSLDNGHAFAVACELGARWHAPGWSSEQVSERLTQLTQLTDVSSGSGDAEQVALLAEALSGVAPVVERLGQAGRPRAEMEAFLRALRERLVAVIARIEDDPALWARAAAALALTAPRDAETSRVRELVRRVRRVQIEVGSDTWIPAAGGLSTSAWLAVAEEALGERERAFRLVATLARLAAAGRNLDDQTRAAARIAAVRLARGAPVSSVRVVVDGRAQTLELPRGEGRLSVPSLGDPGHHTIRVEGAAGAPAFVRAGVTYGVPWDVVPDRPGSLRIAVEGDPPPVDGRAQLTIVVRNRSPRTVVRPVAQVTLFAGAELDEEARSAMLGHGAHAVDLLEGTVQMILGPMPPGAVRKIPLRPRASVGGSLMGLGLAVWPEDRPRDVTVVAPRRLQIERQEAAR